MAASPTPRPTCSTPYAPSAVPAPFADHPLWLLGVLAVSCGALVWIAAGQWILDRRHGDHINPPD